MIACPWHGAQFAGLVCFAGARIMPDMRATTQSVPNERADDPVCLHCLWWGGEEQHALEQCDAPCVAQQIRTHADETCERFVDAAKPEPVWNTEAAA